MFLGLGDVFDRKLGAKMDLNLAQIASRDDLLVSGIKRVLRRRHCLIFKANQIECSFRQLTSQNRANLFWRNPPN